MRFNANTVLPDPSSPLIVARNGSFGSDYSKKEMISLNEFMSKENILVYLFSDLDYSHRNVYSVIYLKFDPRKFMTTDDFVHRIILDVCYTLS